MQKSDGNDPGAVTDEHRAVPDGVGALVTSDVPPAGVGSAQRDLLGRFVTGGGAGKGAGGGAGTSGGVADEGMLTAEPGKSRAPRSVGSDTTEADKEHNDRAQREVGSDGGKLAT
jgi:hypothetical protein